MNDNNPPIDWSDRLVGFGAGLSSALMFAASTRGTGLAMVLAYVCVLPLLIGAVGFSSGAALAGAAAGGVVIAYAGEPVLGLAFFLGFGLPGFLLGALARRTLTKRAPDATPFLTHLSPGALLAGIVLLATASAWCLSAALIWSEGGFAAALDAALTEYGPALDEALRGVKKFAPDFDLTLAKKIVVLSFPAAMAASQSLLLALNLWFAARAVEISGKLHRPWPPLPETLVLPRAIGAAFVLALGFCLAGGVTAVFAGAFAAAAGVALALQGLAVIHALTRAHGSRGGLLAALYASVAVGLLVAPLILTLLSLFGLMESAFSLRLRRSRALKLKETGENNGSHSA
jgi:hypothetical protein